MIFVETSAYLAILLDEENAEAAFRRIEKSSHVFASRLLKLEVERAIARFSNLYPDQQLLAADMRREANCFFARINFVEITKAVLDLAGQINPSSNLRSLDAIHLASFYRLREKFAEVELLSFDQRILDC